MRQKLVFMLMLEDREQARFVYASGQRNISVPHGSRSAISQGSLMSIHSPYEKSYCPLQGGFGAMEPASLKKLSRMLPLAAAILLANQALAQSAEDSGEEKKENAAKTLDSVEVVAAAVARETTIGRQTLSVRQIPQSVVVMDAGRIEDQNLRSLDDVLLHTPGVVLGADSSIENTYYARGHTISSIQYDGMTTTTDAETIASPNMAMYEAVEVLLGSNGVLNGINGFGSINMRRKRPLEYFQLNTGVSGGTWDRYHLDIDVTGPMDDAGRLRGRFVAAYDDKHYFYPYADFKETLLYGTIEADLTDKTTLRVAAHWQDTDAHPNTPGVPFYSDGGDIGLSRSTILSTAWSNFLYDTKNLFVEVNHQFDSGWSAKLMVNYLDTASSNDYAYYWGSIDRETGQGAEGWEGLYGEQLKAGLEQSAFDFTVQGPLSFWGREHQVLLGVTRQIQHYSWYYADSTQYPNAIDIFNFDPTSVTHPGWLPAESYGPDDYTAQTGVFGQIALKATNDLTVMLAGRINWWETLAIEYEGATGEVSSVEDVELNGEFSPLVGVIWDFSDAWSLYASFTDYLTPQSEQTKEGKLLDPMSATNYEIGIKGEMFDGRLSASAALFRLEEDNRAMSDTSGPPNQSGPTYYVASGKTRSDGVELQFNGLITTNWSMNFGYTYNKTKYVKSDEDQGKPFATFTPKHLLKFWTLYRLPFDDGRMSVGMGVVGQSELNRPLNDDWTVYLHKAGYVVVDLRVSYLLNQNWTIGANLNNIFDKTYYAGSVGSDANGNHFYGEPRNVMFTLRAKF